MADFWNKTITLYNKSEDIQTGVISWNRHVLYNCFVKRTNSKINVGNVQLQTDNTIIRILEQSNFILPYEWQNLPNDRMKETITLQAGDLIILGDVSDDIDEYTGGQRSTDIIAKYSVLGSVFVSSVNINADLPNKHYLVMGE